jgi:hypothetical protein
LANWGIYQNVSHITYPVTYFSTKSIGSEYNIIDGVPSGKFDPNNGRHLQIVLSFKELFILEHWNLENPSSRFSSYDELMKFVAKSKDLQVWYKNITARFSYLHELPEWVLLSDDLRERWVMDSSDIYKLHKDRRKAIVSEREKILGSVEDKLQELNLREAEMLDAFYRKYPIVAINKIPVQGLPADRLLKHSNKSGEVLEEALKKELDTFKYELTLKYVIGNESIEELIDLLNQIL